MSCGAAESRRYLYMRPRDSPYAMNMRLRRPVAAVGGRLQRGSSVGRWKLRALRTCVKNCGRCCARLNSEWLVSASFCTLSLARSASSLMVSLARLLARLMRSRARRGDDLRWVKLPSLDVVALEVNESPSSEA